MLKHTLQLLIESILSGAKSYLASHPELGVPLGVFNYKDEPDYAARVHSIKKMGTKGNPPSHKLALQFGIKHPLPSYSRQSDADETAATLSQGDTFEMGGTNYIVTSRGKAKVYTPHIDKSRDVTGKGPSSDMWRKLQTMAQPKTPTGDMSVPDMQDFAKLMTEMKKGSFDLQANMERVTNLLAYEDELRLEISGTIGMSQAQLKDTISDINESSEAAARFGIRATAILKTFMDISETVGRKIRISPQVLERASLLTKTLEGFDAGAFAAAFDTVGYNLTDAMGKVDDTDSAMSEILETGREFGVVMKKFLGTIAGELKLINTYGFEDGVEGLSRMVARGQALKMDMGKVVSLADKFFDPEGAIDFAANMQVIGGAVGDLADPFKLMYMATNDLEGLQTAIQDVAEQAVYFDKEKGKFSISPDQRRQLKAMAEQMGMSYQELADTAVLAAKRAQVFDQIAANIPEEDKEFIASMAEIGKGGVARVKIPSLDKMVEVEDLTPDMIAELEAANLTDQDFYDQQITISEKTNQYLAAIEAAMRIQVEDMGGGAIDTMTLSQRIAETIKPEELNISKEKRDELKTATPARQKEILEEIAKNFTGEFDKITKKAFENIGIKVDDFILRPGQEPVKFNKDDLIIGGTSLLQETENITNRISNMSNVSNVGMAGGKGMVQLEGTITLEGMVGKLERLI